MVLESKFNARKWQNTMRRIFRLISFFSLGFLVGRQQNFHRHEQNISKIVNADYLDDDAKITLLQDLEGKRKAHKVVKAQTPRQKEEKKELMKKRLKQSLKEVKQAAKPLLKLNK